MTPTRKDRKFRNLDIALVLLALLVYLLILSGDYFVPFGESLWLIIAGLALIAGIAARFYLIYRPGLGAVGGWLVANWPLLVLGLALLVGGGLRYQTLKNTPPPTPAYLSFATEAVSVLRQSNWQPKSFVQPPLYLYVGAGVGELSFLQQVSARKLEALDNLNPATLVEPLGYLNLGLGLFTLWPVYATATRLFGRREGVVAALLLATSWLAYQATPALLPATLGAALAASSFYFIIRGWQDGGCWDWWWAGLLAGFATAAVYGAVWLLVPLSLASGRAKSGQPFYGRLGLGWGGWLVGWTLAAPGWILSLNSFLGGLTAIEKAPGEAGSFYFKQALTNDAGLVVIFGLAFVMAFGLRGTKAAGLWLALAFPLLYVITLNLFGPTLLERLALVVPLVAIAGAGPVGLAADTVQRLLDAHDDYHKWGGAGFAVGLTILLALISVLVRRAF